MSGPLPSFLLRLRLLSRARRALLDGDCEAALEHLAHPALAVSGTATRLRARALEFLWRTASRKSRSGRTDSVARLIEVVAREDPRSAEDWSRRLLPAVAGPTADEPRSAASALLARLLAEVRGSLRSVESGGEEGARAERAPRTDAASSGSTASRFHLAIDDVGEFLVACRPRLVLGHSRGDGADLPFLADLESRHASLSLKETFHAGPRWCVEALTEGGVRVNGERVDAARELEDGDEVRLGANLAFALRAPDASSSSVLLELLHGAECDGASRILLLAEGEAGRVRLGALPSRHCVVPGLAGDITLVLVGGELAVRGEDVLRATPEVPRRDGALRVPCPPARRYVISGAPLGAGRPPFSFGLAPGGPA